MISSNPIIKIHVNLLISDHHARDPEYILLVPLLFSEQDFYFIPYFEIESDQSIETAIYDYFDSIDMPLWSYSIRAQSVSVAREMNGNHETVLTRRIYVTAMVDNTLHTDKLIERYSHPDGVSARSYSIEEFHTKLAQGPYYNQDLRDVVAQLRLNR